MATESMATETRSVRMQRPSVAANNGPMENPTNMFADVSKLAKPDLDEELAKNENIQDLIGSGESGDFFKSSQTSRAAWLAKNGIFEIITLTVIVANGLWMGYDCDSNVDDDGKATATLSDADLQFVIMENAFCVYFSFEVLVRWVAFEKKSDCRKDGWFKFDSFLVVLMIFETWLVPVITYDPSGDAQEGSGIGGLTILRLLRLMRLTRMVRLMRSVPELLTLLKGISSATKAVGSTLVLLVLCLYVFAIVFRQNIGSNSPDFFHIFGDIFLSMYFLFSAGTVIDNISDIMYAMKDRSETWSLVAFFFYILISSFTILNMLIGVLVEVVGSVSVGEKEKAVITTVADQLSAIFREIDVDCSGLISRFEFEDMVGDDLVKDNLLKIGIQPKHLALLSDALFEVEDADDEDEDGDVGQGKEITFMEFLKFVIQTRPQNPASVLDISQLRRFFCRAMEKTFRHIDLKCQDSATRKNLLRKKIQKLLKEKKNLEQACTKREDEITEYQKEMEQLRRELDRYSEIMPRRLGSMKSMK